MHDIHKLTCPESDPATSPESITSPCRCNDLDPDQHREEIWEQLELDLWPDTTDR